MKRTTWWETLDWGLIELWKDDAFLFFKNLQKKKKKKKIVIKRQYIEGSRKTEGCIYHMIYNLFFPLITKHCTFFKQLANGVEKHYSRYFRCLLLLINNCNSNFILMFYQLHSNTTVSLNWLALENAVGIMNLQQQPLLTAVMKKKLQ